jgi:hypothetical protein
MDAAAELVLDFCKSLLSREDIVMELVLSLIVGAALFNLMISALNAPKT